MSWTADVNPSQPGRVDKEACRARAHVLRTSPSMKSGRAKARGISPGAARPVAVRVPQRQGIASRRTRAGVGARSAARARAAPTGADDVRGAPGRRRLADLGSLGVMADGSVVDEQHDRRAGGRGDQSGRSDDGEVPRAGGQPRERRCDGGRLEPGPLDAGLHPVRRPEDRVSSAELFTIGPAAARRRCWWSARSGDGHRRPAWSADRRSIFYAFQGVENNKPVARVERVTVGDRARVPLYDGASFPSVSSDGRQLAFTYDDGSGRSLRVGSVDGGDAREIVAASAFRA